MKVKIGGPYLDEKGNMTGSLLVVDAPDQAAVEQFSRDDPYVKAGLFQSVEIRPYRVTVGPSPGLTEATPSSSPRRSSPCAAGEPISQPTSS